MKTKWGLTLSSEEHSPARLVEIAELAEEAGFDFVSISDHFHPWVREQGHAGFVWAVLGAIAARTKTIELGVGVTCPIMRIHPAILAQAVATTSLLCGGRLTWGVGTGEALNEHILGDRWAPQPVRLEMLEEAIDLIRRLWTEESVTHYGRHFTVEDARLLDRPTQSIPIVVSAYGPDAARVAAQKGDGLWISGVKDTINDFHKSGGSGPVYSQLTICWGDSREKALTEAHRLWAFSSLPGSLNANLRTMADFEEAVGIVTEEMVSADIPCGPDPEPVIEMARKAVEAGVDHLYFHQIGADQEGFARFWSEELRPALADL